MYYSLILAQWFKQRQGDPTLRSGQAGFRVQGTEKNNYIQLINSKNLTGLTSKQAWSKDTYFKDYQKSFKDGAYNLKEPVKTPYGQAVRSYFSGGMSFDVGIQPFGTVNRGSSPVSTVVAASLAVARGNDITMTVQGMPEAVAGIQVSMSSTSLGLAVTKPAEDRRVESASSPAEGKIFRQEYIDYFSAIGDTAQSVVKTQRKQKIAINLCAGTSIYDYLLLLNMPIAYFVNRYNGLSCDQLKVLEDRDYIKNKRYKVSLYKDYKDKYLLGFSYNEETKASEQIMAAIAYEFDTLGIYDVCVLISKYNNPVISFEWQNAKGLRQTYRITFIDTQDVRNYAEWPQELKEVLAHKIDGFLQKAAWNVPWQYRHSFYAKSYMDVIADSFENGAVMVSDDIVTADNMFGEKERIDVSADISWPLRIIKPGIDHKIIDDAIAAKEFGLRQLGGSDDRLEIAYGLLLNVRQKSAQTAAGSPAQEQSTSSVVEADRELEIIFDEPAVIPYKEIDAIFKNGRTIPRVLESVYREYEKPVESKIYQAISSYYGVPIFPRLEDNIHEIFNHAGPNAKDAYIQMMDEQPGVKEKEPLEIRYQVLAGADRLVIRMINNGRSPKFSDRSFEKREKSARRIGKEGHGFSYYNLHATNIKAQWELYDRKQLLSDKEGAVLEIRIDNMSIILSYAEATKLYKELEDMLSTGSAYDHNSLRSVTRDLMDAVYDFPDDERVLKKARRFLELYYLYMVRPAAYTKSMDIRIDRAYFLKIDISETPPDLLEKTIRDPFFNRDDISNQDRINVAFLQRTLYKEYSHKFYSCYRNPIKFWRQNREFSVLLKAAYIRLRNRYPGIEDIRAILGFAFEEKSVYSAEQAVRRAVVNYERLNDSLVILKSNGKRFLRGRVESGYQEIKTLLNVDDGAKFLADLRRKAENPNYRLWNQWEKFSSYLSEFGIAKDQYPMSEFWRNIVLSSVQIAGEKVRVVPPFEADAMPGAEAEKTKTSSPFTQDKSASSTVEKAKEWTEGFISRFGAPNAVFGGVKELDNPMAKAQTIDNNEDYLFARTKDFELEARQGVKISYEDLGYLEPVSSSLIPQAIDMPGGIDFRSLPIVTQAMSNLSLNTSRISSSSLKNINLDQELREIQSLLDAGIIPSTDRIKDYVIISCLKENSNMQKVVSCIADILRLEEDHCCLTETVLKDILVVLESGRSVQELKAVFIGITAGGLT